MSRKYGSLGSTLMITQQHYNHQKQLNSIYSRRHSLKHLQSYPSHNNIHSRYSKKQQYQDQYHLKTIRHLFQTLNKSKSMADRYKDPHDFIAYPALFFRQTSKTAIKKTKKKQQNNRNLSIIPTSQTPKFTKQKIREYLPVLTNFQQSQFEQFTDGINKMIINFDILTKRGLRQLQKIVISLLPKRCPQEFSQAVNQMFRQIEQSIDQ